jgi:Fur family transcriptional regulator, peroxide stress response regulator
MPTTLPTDALSQRLADSGLRSTPQREVVYRLLLTSRSHPTADEVYAAVRSGLPTMSLATVYNCLDALVHCNLVRAVNFERAPTRYCANLHPHAHFHDEETGQTHDVDLPAAVIAQLKAILPQGYSPSSVEITFRGRAVARPASDPNDDATSDESVTTLPPPSPAVS